MDASEIDLKGKHVGISNLLLFLKIDNERLERLYIRLYIPSVIKKIAPFLYFLNYNGKLNLFLPILEKVSMLHICIRRRVTSALQSIDHIKL